MVQADVLTPAGEVRTHQGTPKTTGSSEGFLPNYRVVFTPDCVSGERTFAHAASLFLRGV